MWRVLRARCPMTSGIWLALGAMILHLNDDHHWTREAIAKWVAPPDSPPPETAPPSDATPA